MTFEFEYNGEFEFIFENVLSVDQEGTCDKKNRGQKSRARVPLS